MKDTCRSLTGPASTLRLAQGKLPMTQCKVLGFKYLKNAFFGIVLSSKILNNAACRLPGMIRFRGIDNFSHYGKENKC
jgi:hypothetical protein